MLREEISTELDHLLLMTCSGLYIVADPGFRKGGFMPPFDAHAHLLDAMKVAAAVLTASNYRETVSLFANYTSSNGVSMETVETPPQYCVCILCSLFSR